jgi:hypothetical protein
MNIFRNRYAAGPSYLYLLEGMAKPAPPQRENIDKARQILLVYAIDTHTLPFTEWHSTVDAIQ